MAIKKVRIKPPGYTDIVHPETSADVVKFSDGSTVEAHKADDAPHGIGDKSTLLTTEKSTIVGAVNELFTDVSNGKTSIASAIADMGQLAAGSDTFAQLAQKIRNISKDATAYTDGILAGLTAYVGGVKITGTMPNRGGVVITPGTVNQAIAEGYHTGAGYVVGDPDLIPANILSGKNIFGVNGAFSASAIKSIQRGTTLLQNANTIDVTIASVDLNHAVVLVNDSNYNSSVVADVSSLQAYAQLTSSTNLQLGAVGRTTFVGWTSISWQVIEFYNVKSVQRGLAYPASDAVVGIDVSISAVNMGKTILLSSVSARASNQWDIVSPGVKLTSETSINIYFSFSRSYDMNGSIVSWEVIEFN